MSSEYITVKNKDYNALRARIAELEKELRIYDEAIRDCAIDMSLGGNRPVSEYIADARKNLSAPPEEVSNDES